MIIELQPQGDDQVAVTQLKIEFNMIIKQVSMLGNSCSLGLRYVLFVLVLECQFSFFPSSVFGEGISF